ncbi:MAG: HAMP domain-containing histidine kinase [Anaerolineales bacterium]|nr:HAMP domain-containing histidine kinase [Anaerolineales bacterium]
MKRSSWPRHPDRHSRPAPDWQHPMPPEWHNMPFSRSSNRSRRFVFMRFLFVFGGLTVIFLTALVVILYLVFQLPIPRPETSQPGRLAFMFCAVPTTFMLLAALLGAWTIRRLGSPMAEIMTATETVSQGNLSIRVDEHRPGEFGRAARSFNRMVAELERSEQQRRNLTADVAHELRTPLHILQGNLEGMLDGIYAATPENLTAMLDETRLLARLVNDLQVLSLAEAGQLPLHRTRVLVADLLADVAASFAPQAESQGLALRVEIQEGHAAISVEADRDRLDQVLSNLVANALRHTPEGGEIALGAGALPGGVHLTVRDTGSGIPAEDLPYVFDRFWRGNKARTRAEGAGSGLGLAIARQLVRAHGGTIEVTSQPGQVTTFTIALPKQ